MPRRRQRFPLALLACATLAVIAACGPLRRGGVDDAADAATATRSCRTGTEPSTAVLLPELRPDVRQARAEICQMMDSSAMAWNRGDLEAFVADYTDDATYIGSRGLVRGRTAIGAAYAPRFQRGVQRDSLSFREIEVDLLAPNVANVIATYVLMRGDSVTSRGPTSLVMRRFGGRWRIAHDHSS